MLLPSALSRAPAAGPWWTDPVRDATLFAAGALALVTALCPGASAARTWRITPTGSGDAPTIQAGIDSAAAGDVVLLTAGRYTWSEQAAGGVAMLRFGPGITLRGESGATATVLDAESRGRIADCVDVGATFVCEDLTFENGLAPQDGAPLSTPTTIRSANDSHGGAIDVRGTSAPTLRRCVFRNNRASGGTASGGAVACASATFEDCVFVANIAGLGGPTNGHGGAVYCDDAQFVRCTFSDNHTLGYSATSGGAVQGISPTFIDCAFESNAIEGPGGIRGGAVACTGRPTLTGCVFRDNRVLGHYFHASGGAAEVGSGSVTACIFVGNVAACKTAPGRGGALSGSDPTIVGCTFARNEALQTEPLGPGQGGAVFAHFPSRFENCTFVANSAGTADGVAVLALPEGGSVNACLVAATPAGRLTLGTETWTCCDLFGNAAGDRPSGIDGGANLDLDPLFCSDSPAANGDVSVRADSPCAAAANPQAPRCAAIGSGGVGCAAQPVASSTWSAVKQLYRARGSSR